jgi:hypothetical protein
MRKRPPDVATIVSAKSTADSRNSGRPVGHEEPMRHMICPPAAGGCMPRLLAA